MFRPVLKDSTDISVIIRIVDSADGTPETGVTSATSGLDLEYRRDGATSVDLTESDLAAVDSAHSDGGMKHIGNGYYRIDLPDAAVATGANGVLVHGTVTGMVVIGCYVPLVSYNPYDGVRLGLTALPNAAAEAAGGLYTRGTGAGQINQQNNGMIDTQLANAVTHGGTSAMLRLGSSTTTPAFYVTQSNASSTAYAVHFDSSSGGGSAFRCNGGGAGHGIDGRGGTTGAGISGTGGTTGGHGILGTGNNNASGTTAGSGIRGVGALSPSGGGTAGPGLDCVGGAAVTSGRTAAPGIKATKGTNSGGTEAAGDIVANGGEISGYLTGHASPAFVGRGAQVDVSHVSGDSTAADTLELFAEALDQTTGQIDAGTFADDVNTYQAKVGYVDDNGASTDRYEVTWFKNSQPVTSGITSPTIQVVKAADGTDLIASTAMTEIASTGRYRYNATGAERQTSGAMYGIRVQATIDGSTRTWYQWTGRDST